MPPQYIYMCQPTYGSPDGHSVKQFWGAALKPSEMGGKYTKENGWALARNVHGSSLLASAFNHHWCNALNARYEGHDVTRFVMLHDDIVPEDWWAEKLLDELEVTGADLVAAVVPIKDNRGLTSCAVDDLDDRWTVLRRLTMREVMGLPETFGHDDLVKANLAYPDTPVRTLLINTGCWACRMDRGWERALYDGFDNQPRPAVPFFTIQDRIVKNPTTGRYEQHVVPEDWFFSRQLNMMGFVDIRATRKVKLGHRGDLYYPNHWADGKPWGDYEKGDEDLAYKFREKEIAEAQAKETKYGSR